MGAPVKAGGKYTGLLAAEPFPFRTCSPGRHERKSGGEGQTREAQAMAAIKKPWADQPWPLIDMPLIHHTSHPALNIANQMAHIHNAMIRGLNAIYLQAPHVRQTQDITDLLFLTQSWSAWLLDHHDLKEGTMFPGFEAALGVPAGTLTLPRKRSPRAPSSHSDGRTPTAIKKRNGNEKGVYKRGEAEEGTVSSLLYRVYSYASTTHKDPHKYDAAVLEALLVSLADSLVPHLTAQIGLLASMREMCFDAPAGITPLARREVPAPLPVPMVTITRTPSHTSSTPALSSPSLLPSSASTESGSTPSPPRVTFSLFPSTRPASKSRTTSPNASTNTGISPSAKLTTEEKRNQHKGNHNPKPRDTSTGMIDKHKQPIHPHQTSLQEATTRAATLSKIYLAAEAQATASADRFVVPPMIVRLRDVTFSSPVCGSSSASLSSRSGRGRGKAKTRSGSGSGNGNGSVGEWPWLSVPAVHAIADRLSGEHEGAWRFLPCDVWGRPRELRFLG
ncbi:hypothetical protein F4861DRAFT_202587 [Xylaria intraflava]|nr:hypothetical protein F4861DRAFT_202587 [Xylaria intraflava]